MKARDRQPQRREPGQHPEMGVLTGFGLFSAAGLVSMLLASLITGRPVQAFDDRILLLLRNASDLSLPVGPFWLAAAGRDITALGSFSVLTLVTVMVTVYLLLSDRGGLAAFVVLAIVTGALLTFGLKLAFARPRPDLVPLSTWTQVLSFPSGHAMMAAVVYLTLATLLTQIAPRAAARSFSLIAGIVLTVLIGLSRLYLGVHWPTDVLAGWTLGAGWAILCRLVLLGQVDRWRRATNFAIKRRDRVDNRRTEWPTTKDSPKG